MVIFLFPSYRLVGWYQLATGQATYSAAGSLSHDNRLKIQLRLTQTALSVEEVVPLLHLQVSPERQIPQIKPKFAVGTAVVIKRLRDTANLGANCTERLDHSWHGQFSGISLLQASSFQRCSFGRNKHCKIGQQLYNSSFTISLAGHLRQRFHGVVTWHMGGIRNTYGNYLLERSGVTAVKFPVLMKLLSTFS